MQEDFHYYATYCAAYIAGYSHAESLDIAYSAQFVDLCSKSLLSGIHAPLNAATTQLKLELMDTVTDIIGLQEITRIWSSFHFLPQDLYVNKKHRTKRFMFKYRLICGPNGDLLVDTVSLAKDKTLQAVGIAMHVLADTWAHRYFAGTPSLVMNSLSYDTFELIREGEEVREQKITFRHSASAPDDLENSIYTNTIYRSNENSIMNLGHGRCGHLPDYSFITYRYLPSWGEYKEIVKDNPSDYKHAFCQMIHALKYLRGDIGEFQKDTYDFEAISSWEEKIDEILKKRQLNACADWKQFAFELSGQEICDFDVEKYLQEYRDASAEEKDTTFIGKFCAAAIAQKSMVTNRIYSSGNILAGFSKKLLRFRKAGK